MNELKNKQKISNQIPFDHYHNEKNEQSVGYFRVHTKKKNSYTLWSLHSLSFFLSYINFKRHFLDQKIMSHKTGFLFY
jgi:hypothetical protein